MDRMLTVTKEASADSNQAMPCAISWGSPMRLIGCIAAASPNCPIANCPSSNSVRTPPGATALMRIFCAAFESGEFGHSHHAELGRGIRSELRRALQAGNRADVYNRAASFAPYLPDLMLHAVIGAHQIDVDHGPKDVAF
jgi:hypothetical protein